MASVSSRATRARGLKDHVGDAIIGKMESRHEKARGSKHALDLLEPGYDEAEKELRSLHSRWWMCSVIHPKEERTRGITGLSVTLHLS